VIKQAVTGVVSYAVTGVLSFTFLALLGLVMARNSVEESGVELPEPE